MAVYQPGKDTVWEMWIVNRDPSGTHWSACWGGRITHASRSNGVFPHPYGVAASGLSYLASTIKVSELQAGHIDHALAVAVLSAAPQVRPANRSDGGGTIDGGSIPEGTRFRLKRSVNVMRLGLPPAGVVIARALQTYGMIVTDQAGAVVLEAEDSQPYVVAGLGDPYASLFGSTPPHLVLARIPWKKLEAVSPSASRGPRTRRSPRNS
jgi:hypothetical protein